MLIRAFQWHLKDQWNFVRTLSWLNSFTTGEITKGSNARSCCIKIRDTI